MKRWSNGDPVLLRRRRKGQVSWAKPVRIVEDSPDFTALYLVAGTKIMRPVALDGSPRPREMSYEQRYVLPTRTGDGVWRNNSMLMLTRPGAAHSFCAFWRASDWQFRDWYVNLQAPLRRTPLGFDTEDHLLDIVIAPDLSSWEWKDAEEFEAAQRVGRFKPEEADAIRAEGEAAIAAIESRSWPFDAGWEEWCPDPTWTVPEVPPSWDES
jgi:hypothetical protein